LILGWWNDAYRVLVEAPRRLDKFDLENISKWIFPVSEEEVGQRFNEYLQARFPFGYKMKFVAERFGVFKRGKTISQERMEELHFRFKDTPIYKETLREAYQEKVDLDKSKELMRSIGNHEIEISMSIVEAPSPFSRHILMQYADMEELMAPEYIIRDELEYMKRSLEARTVQLACLECGEWDAKAKLRDLSEKPRCEKCGSSLLALIDRDKSPQELLSILNQWKQGRQLSSEDKERLTYSRKTADLVLSYGRKAIVALLVHGVGPQTAYQVLSRMHRDEKDLYNDLLKAKIQYIRNRPYWDRSVSR
jgi:ATP-dependent Lhr-like helicase